MANGPGTFFIPPPIHRIELTGMWDGEDRESTSHINLHAKIEFTNSPNSTLPLLDLSDEGVELLLYGVPIRLDEDSYPSTDPCSKCEEERNLNGSTRGRKRERSPLPIAWEDMNVKDGSPSENSNGNKKIEANGKAEPVQETPRTLYQKEMGLQPSSTKRRLFPPSPTEGDSRKPSFKSLPYGLDSVSPSPQREKEDDGDNGGVSKSPEASPIAIPARSEADSAVQSFGTARAEIGDDTTEIDDLLSELNRGTNSIEGSVENNFRTSGYHRREEANTDSTRRQSNTSVMTMLSVPTASLTPKPLASRIPIKTQRLARPSKVDEELLGSSVPEPSSRNTAASPSQTMRPQHQDPPAEKPSLLPTTPKNEHISPLRLSSTLPDTFGKPRKGKELQQSPTRPGNQNQSFLTIPQSDPRGSRRQTQFTPGRDTKIPIRKGENDRNGAEKSAYISKWLLDDEFRKSSDSPLDKFYPTEDDLKVIRANKNGERKLSPGKAQKNIEDLKTLEEDAVSTEGQNKIENHETSEDVALEKVKETEGSGTLADVAFAKINGNTEDHGRTEEDEVEDEVSLPSPTSSSQRSMPWNSAADMARKYAEANEPDEITPDLGITIVQRPLDSLYIVSSKDSKEAVYSVEFDMKVKLGAVQPDGWQILKVPGLPLDTTGGKGILKLQVVHGSNRRRLECGNNGLLGFEREDAGFTAYFDMVHPLAVPIRAVEILTGNTLDNRVLNYEIKTALKRRRRLGAPSILEYTAICELSLYQKIVSIHEGCAFTVIISDGPGGYFEWTLRNEDREFRIDRKARTANDFGITRVKTFCKVDHADEPFRIIWEVPAGTHQPEVWAPKLFFLKPNAAVEYKRSLRSPGIERADETRITASSEMGQDTGMERLELGDDGEDDDNNGDGDSDSDSDEDGDGDDEDDDDEDDDDDDDPHWNFMDFTGVETEDIHFWFFQDVARPAALLLLYLKKWLRSFISISPRKVLVGLFIMQIIFVFNDQIPGPTIGNGCSQLPCPRSDMQYEPFPGSFRWFARERELILNKGLLGYVSHITGIHVTLQNCENLDPKKRSKHEEDRSEGHSGKGHDVDSTVAKDATQIGSPAFPVRTSMDIGGERRPAYPSTGSLYVTMVEGGAGNRGEHDPAAFTIPSSADFVLLEDRANTRGKQDLSFHPDPRKPSTPPVEADVNTESEQSSLIASSNSAASTYTTSLSSASPTKEPLRDRIDKFLGWKGPLE
ncbi:hypothetical protein AJ79_05985 [Helicocarpus griseus UAMH5409]|uniref:Uncharacterized protein n=1 Tax=Helicocarpus griseus UAMH5409 TaxID=1447875 RepID=A0A2B7XH96_9EURO|nr:hypothetical protein AJ79_05985 [Helicocarpus griseus UAMH5409]